MVAGSALAELTADADRQPAAAREPGVPDPGKAILFEGCPTLERALRIAAGIYPKRRRKDLKSLTDGDNHDYRMSLSTRLSICMSPDLTFALLGGLLLATGRGLFGIWY